MRTAICNELFTETASVGETPWPWQRQCEFAAEVGYDGLEVAPHTLGASPLDMSAADRNEMKQTAADAGVEIIGLHWLLAHTEGLHLTTADAATRRRTSEYLAGLAHLCGDLGGRVMVLGSPMQRSREPGMTAEEAMSNAAETIRGAVSAMSDRGVVLCLEPLSPVETDFLNTCAQGRELIGHVASPVVRLHQDVKAMASESTPIPTLIEEFADVTEHFHANDPNLRGPGMGDVDFAPIAAALAKRRYEGFVSVEVFDYEPGVEATARESHACLRECGVA